MTVSLKEIIPFSPRELAANQRGAFSKAQLDRARNRIARRSLKKRDLLVRFIFRTRLGRITGGAMVATCYGVLSLWYIIAFYAEPAVVVATFVATLIAIGAVARTFMRPLVRFTDWQTTQPSLKCVEGVLRVIEGSQQAGVRSRLQINGERTLDIPLDDLPTPITEDGQLLRFYVLDFGYIQELAAFEECP